MNVDRFRGELASVLLAGLVLAAASPWGEFQLPLWPALIGAGCALFVVRPRGWMWWHWLGPAAAVAIRLVPAPVPSADEVVQAQFDERCRTILEVARTAAEDPRIASLVAGEGETLDPELPFRLLDRASAGDRLLTVYLSDDRGRVVAWGGDDRRYPYGIRPLGQRQWQLVWTASWVSLVLREPLMVEGRLSGAITVVETASASSQKAFGIRAPPGWMIDFGSESDAGLELKSDTANGITLPMSWRRSTTPWSVAPPWAPWALFALVLVVKRPGCALVAAALAGFSNELVNGSALGIAATILLTGLAVSGLVRRFPMVWRRPAIAFFLVLGAAGSLFGRGEWSSSWLPAHLVPPGAGVVWLIAAAWILAAWPVKRWDLERRLALGFVAALMAVAVNIAAVALELARDETMSQPDLPTTATLDERTVLGGTAAARFVTDLAPKLAVDWGLDAWEVGAELVVSDRDGLEVSRWGDLSRAGNRSVLHSEWRLVPESELRVELRVAREPWSLLRDWSTSGGLDRAAEAPIWWVVLTRSGTVAASLHPDVRPINPHVAGSLYHRRGGWHWMEISGARYPARIRRQGPWLVAKIAHQPPAVVWFVRVLSGALWAMLALIVVRPPTIRRRWHTTFNGRLRLLAAGAVVVPLTVLAVVFHFRVTAQDKVAERAMGSDAFKAARYTVEHLAEGLVVDDNLARWLAEGWGGEVSFFDGINLLATSRPDLIEMRKLPEVPISEAFPVFLLGRDDIVVRRWNRELVVAGAVRLQGADVLMQLTNEPPAGVRESPGALDWLVGVSVVAALLALVLAGKVTERLSYSLEALVGLSRRLLHGEPVGEVSHPKEQDLSEVLEAVLLMARVVQEREATLRDQEEMLRITLATLEPAVFVLDDKGRQVFSNPSADRMNRECSPQTLAEVLQHEPGEELAMVTMRPMPGGDVTWRLGAAEVPLPGGAAGRVVVVEDVSEVVRAERLEQLTHMARIVAHEVKNPLTPIRLWVQELEEARRIGDRQLGPLVDQACSEVLSQMERLQNTANAFSNLVALERWEPDQIDLSELVADAVAHFDVLRRRGTEIRLGTEPPGVCVVMADVEWLRRALDTLLLNSVTAIDDHGGLIEVRTKCDDHWRFVEIEDDGGGVGADRLEDLFSPHFSTTGTGTGLGLALVRQVMTRAHGQVEALNGRRGLIVRLQFPAPFAQERRPQTGLG